MATDKSIKENAGRVYSRVDPDVKEQAQAVLDRLGITMSVAISMFLHQIVIDNGLPFQPSTGREIDKSSHRAQ